MTADATPAAEEPATEDPVTVDPATEQDSLVLLATPRDGVPKPITTPAELAEVITRFSCGTGSIAVDAERASGYRYSQRAYLVQLRREGAGTVLIDPIALPELSTLNAVIDSAEWVLHAANQDLPCLAELGLIPSSLFDTELAGRLLGVERVALGTMVAEHLGIRLEKGHSAADWSVRPLPDDWLSYAALDVELLVSLRDILYRQLDEAGKLEWARQEFEHVRLSPPPSPREQRWRRTSGIHSVRTRRGLAAVRALWESRDELAQMRDIAPGRILPDSAIIAAVRAAPATAEALGSLPVYGGPRQRRNLQRWFGALQQAQALPAEQLPSLTPSTDTVPPTSRWKDREPEAAERLVRCRAAIAELAETHQVLAQNLLASDVVRRLAWTQLTLTASATVSPDDVAETLAGFGARPWQIALTESALAKALTEAHRATAAESTPTEDAASSAE